MKPPPPVLLTAIMLLVGCNNRDELAEDRETTRLSDSTLLEELSMPENTYEIAEIYISMRQQVLELHDENIGEIKDKAVWAVLMETGYSDAVVTLVAVADGAASLYFSNGGGIIGAGEHENVRPASLELVRMADEFLTDMEKTETYPIPTPQMTMFYVVTPKGVFTYAAKEEDLGEQRDKLSRLFHQGHELLGQMRIAEQERQTE